MLRQHVIRRPIMNSDIELSINQQKILDAIRSYCKEKGYAPCVRDICTETGIKSTSTVHLHLNNLEKMGYIRRDKTKSRAIELIDDLDSTDTTNAAPTAMIPVIGNVAAGSPILAEQNIMSYFPIPEDKLPTNQVFMLNVRGDSMINAGIFSGDYILVEYQKTASNGDIVVALIDDSATVKTFYKESEHIRLQPENDALDPIIVRDVEILGKVIGVFRFMF